jgi:hypothetical protein
MSCGLTEAQKPLRSSLKANFREHLSELTNPQGLLQHHLLEAPSGLPSSITAQKAGNDVIYGGSGREEVDSQTGTDDHGVSGISP